MRRLALLLSLLLVGLSPHQALADKRVALVVGNAAYARLAPLRTAVDDSAALAALLKTAGFEVVQLENVGNADFRRAIREFTLGSRGADSAVVYFAGHGVEARGKSYLVPVDAALNLDIDVPDETISLDRVLDTIESAKQVRLVLLDTCQGNPIVPITTNPGARDSPEVSSSSNALVAFAAKLGSACQNGPAPNSIFTAALLKHLATPGLDIRVALGRVQDDVRKETDNRQQPVVQGGGAFGGAEFALVQRPAQTAASPTKVIPDPDRLALVIGNAAYQFAPALKNAVNDANLVSDALASAGFDVATVSDVNRSELDRALRGFLSKVAARGKDTVALFFYAGQGVEIDGENFLVPVDIRIQQESDVLTQAVPLSTLLSSLSLLPSATRIVIFDTSRTNPFSPQTPPTGAVIVPPGSIVAFSTSSGAEANEGAGANSPFSAAFAQTIKEPGLAFEQVFQKVRDRVSKATDGQQIPQENSSLKTPFRFTAAVPGGSSQALTPSTGRAEDPEGRSDYELALGINTEEAWQAFLQVHPSGFYATLARAQLGKLGTAGAGAGRP
jgi:uncharacterized caspase-like protein